jgi:DNA polymerase III epsilon subunit-like protein
MSSREEHKITPIRHTEKEKKRMKKIDRRITYYAVLDTETANTEVEDMKFPMVYDLGFAIVDKRGTVYETFDFVIYEIYARAKDLMKTAYYADKLPQYETELKDGTRKMVSILTAYKTFRNVAKEYNIKAVIAHNASFDLRALNATIRYLSGSKIRYFFPFGLAVWDSQKMAHDTICKQKSYIEFCKENGLMTNHKTPRVRETAEALHRYRLLDNNYKERHTALSDVMIEKDIFARCMAQHKPMRKALFNN